MNAMGVALIPDSLTESGVLAFEAVTTIGGNDDITFTFQRASNGRWQCQVTNLGALSAPQGCVPS